MLLHIDRPIVNAKTVDIPVVVQSLSCVMTPWTAAHQASLSFTISQSFLRLMSIESVMLLPISSSATSPFCFNLAQHQSLFQWAGSSHQVGKGLELRLQHQPSEWIFRLDSLWDSLVWSPCSPKDSQESSPTTQFESINSLVLSLPYDPTLIPIHD